LGEKRPGKRVSINSGGPEYLPSQKTHPQQNQTRKTKKKKKTKTPKKKKKKANTHHTSKKPNPPPQKKTAKPVNPKSNPRNLPHQTTRKKKKKTNPKKTPPPPGNPLGPADLQGIRHGKGEKEKKNSCKKGDEKEMPNCLLNGRIVS